MGRISGDSWRCERTRKGQGPKGRTVFRSRCQSGEPTRVLGLFRNDVLEMRIDQHIDVGKEHCVLLPHRPNRTRSSSVSSDLGESRSTPGRRRALRTVTRRNGVGSDGTCRLSASSRTLAMNALTLRPWAAAVRRTCLPRRSSSDMVVLMMKRIIGYHKCIKPDLAPRCRSRRKECRQLTTRIGDDQCESRSACPCQPAAPPHRGFPPNRLQLPLWVKSRSTIGTLGALAPKP